MADLSSSDRAKYTHFYQDVASESEDGDGGIGLGDFEKLMILCGHIWSRELVAGFFTEIDLDEDWKISLEDFLNFISKISPSGSKQSVAAAIRRRFNEQDLNKDGFISPDELRSVLASVDLDLGEDWIQNFIKQWDTDADGRLNFEEFVNMYVRTELIQVDEDADEETKKELDEAATKVTGIFVSSDKVRRMCSEKGLIEEGMVRVEDIKTVLADDQINFPDDQISMCIETLDSQGTGQIQLEELMDMYEEMCSQQCDAVDAEMEVDIMKEEEEDIPPPDPVPVAQGETQEETQDALIEAEQMNGGTEEQSNVLYEEPVRTDYEEPRSPTRTERIQEPIASHKTADIEKRSEAFEGKNPKTTHAQLSDDGAKKECREVGVRSMIACWEHKGK